MNKRIFMLASLGAMAAATRLPVHAAPTLMSTPVAMTAAARAALLRQLDASRAARGLDARLGYAIVREHPGLQGTGATAPARTRGARR